MNKAEIDVFLELSCFFYDTAGNYWATGEDYFENYNNKQSKNFS